MTTPGQEETLRRLAASGLRGRGGAWFETYRKWRAVLAEVGSPVVVANGGEGEPGSIKDRFILRTKAPRIVGGLKLAMNALGADRGYIYLKGSFQEERRLVEAEILRSGLESSVTVHMGDDTYVGGEETALLESLERRKAWPRPKPPRPTAMGLHGRPTVVQNVDTLSRVEEAVRLGAEFPENDTLTVTLWGDVRLPGAYEVKMGTTIRSTIDSFGGGPTAPIGLVFPNGAHSLPLSPAQLDSPLDSAALTALGTSLGTASILVLDDRTSNPSILDSIARFFEREACGQCPPCVLGAQNLRRLVSGDRESTIRLTPQAAIRETASFMSMHGYCGHARAGASAVTGLFELWQGEILDRLRGRHTEKGLRDRDPFAPGSAERESLDRFLQDV
jgi:NADH:ubiquinone oxidoreductase subunit F (NADH-binding)